MPPVLGSFGSPVIVLTGALGWQFYSVCIVVIIAAVFTGYVLPSSGSYGSLRGWGTGTPWLVGVVLLATVVTFFEVARGLVGPPLAVGL
ncbi:MAG: hypothetical protein AB8B45_04180, partial [Prochlorococcus sp.]